jgi:hypothetical protein
MADAATKISSPLKPYDYGQRRYFDFTEFEELGKEFMVAFANGFVKYSSTISPDTAQSSFSTAVNFLQWVTANELQLKGLVSSLRLQYQQSKPKDWEDTVALWQVYISGRDGLQSITKYNFIKQLNTLFKKLFGFGVIPKFDLVGAPQLYRESRPTKTLAEAAHHDSGQYTETILNEALSGTMETGIELEVKRDFLKTLIDETGAIAGTPEEHAKLLMKINADRLAAIRRAAEKDFTKWLEWWNEGQCALRDCDMSFEEILATIDKRVRQRFSYNLFPVDNEYLCLGRLLKYFVNHPRFRGRIVGYPRGSYPRRVAEQLYRLGGAQIVQARLFPHIDLTNAVIVLVLCDTGANVTVARTLPNTCLDNSENPGYKVIRGNKMRASGKLITNELPIKDSLHQVSCVQAIQTYQQISESIRTHASGNKSKLLFLQATAGGVEGVSKTLLTRWFRTLCESHDEISHLHIHAKMIRPSVLMQAAFDKETGIIPAAAIADHSSLRTTNLYISRYPNKVIWERFDP